MGLLVAALIGGCVSPGPIGSDILNRYQRRLAEKGPQARGNAGLDRLRPELGTTGPELETEVVPDPETGLSRTRIELSLIEAIYRALANNLSVRVVSYDPAIAREEMVRAAAEFDYTLFGGFTYEETDEQTTTAFISSMSRRRRFEAGLRQKAVTGAEWQLALSLSRVWDNNRFTAFRTRYEPVAELSITQPLLRNAWPAFNLASLRIARLGRKLKEAEFRQRVEQVVTEVIDAYWTLYRARGEYAIQKELLNKTIQTRDRIEKRMKLDATRVELKQAEAAVATRRAALIRADKAIGDAEDDLARRLADSQIALPDQYEIVPTTPPTTELVQPDVESQLLEALEHNPVLEQARVAIEQAAVNVTIARNQTLPKLDLSAGTTLQSLDQSRHEAFDEFFTGNFFSSMVQLTFEYPVANRARRADLRRARYQHTQALVRLQKTADEVATSVKERIRQIHTTHAELQAQNAAVEAAALQLQALEDTERIRGRLTPEFLQVKLDAQQTLASAQQAHLRARAAYNTALVDLARATGTVLDLHRVELALPAAADEKPWEPRQEPPTRPSGPIETRPGEKGR